MFNQTLFSYIMERENMEENKVLFSVAEVGKMFGIGKVKVYELIKKGYFPALYLGGLKIKKTTLEEFLSKYEGYDFKDLTNVVKMAS